MNSNARMQQGGQRNASPRGGISPAVIRWFLIIALFLFITYGLPLINDVSHPPVHQIVLVDVSGSMFRTKKPMRDGTPRDLVYISLARTEQILQGLRRKDNWDLYFYVHKEADPALSDVDPKNLLRELKGAYDNVSKRYQKDPDPFKGTDQAVPLEKAAELMAADRDRKEQFQILICCDGEQDWTNPLVKARVKKAVTFLAGQKGLNQIEFCGIDYPNRNTMMDWTKPLGAKIIFRSLMED